MDFDYIKGRDFIEIDGHGDPDLEKNFLDNRCLDRIINDKVFFFVAKKGPGKSAIHQMIEKHSARHGHIVVTKDFGDFPFEKLLDLKDESSAKADQYQTIWRNVIVHLLVQAISQLPHEDNHYYNEIKLYNDIFLGNAVDVHKETVSNTLRKRGGLHFRGIDTDAEKQTGSESKLSYKMTAVNRILGELISNHFMCSNVKRRIIIQFDRLDDKYDLYQSSDDYHHAISSLFKVVHSNQLLRSKGRLNAKIVLHIRSDMMRAMALRDAESGRWGDFRFDLNRGIVPN